MADQININYKILMDSGCLHLPSQRTLRDHYAKASCGFSALALLLHVCIIYFLLCITCDLCLLLCWTKKMK